MIPARPLAAAFLLLACVPAGADDAGKARRERLDEADRVAGAGPYKADWESLKTVPIPEWYLDGKFGVFIHWGLYSVPAFGNEWYPRNMYKADTPEFRHHVATYGPQARFGYKDFIPRFTADKYDPAAWADLFRRAGARFVVPVAEHHDGFAMYDTALGRWSAAKMGPKRDLVGDLARAVREKGLVFALSTHRAEHWWFFDQGMGFDSDVRSKRWHDFYGPAQPEKAPDGRPNPPDQAYLDDWLARTVELVEKYHPQLVWFDWWIEQPVFAPYLRRFAAYYYNQGVGRGEGVAINYKNAAFPDGAAVLDVERGQLAAIRPFFWQTDTSISRNSWGYVARQDYKTADSLVDDLVDIVSKNGALLLNIGPRRDGTIPEEEQRILLEIGRWLDTNGEAIYGTRPWTVFGEGPTPVVEGSFNDTKRAAFTGEDIRFTAKGSTLYAIALAWPRDGRLVVRSLARGGEHAPPAIATVALLGRAESPRWTWDASGLAVELPGPPPGDHAFALRIVTGP
ncbi:MAG TPA: alpha-L-fucosidase [Vicinamibacteria bacterium]|nr:alpha-L-fucosidase [Vicinamibacteria bacterium]